MVTEISTSRLLLRQWRASDLEPFAQLNADPEVMEHFPATLSGEQSDQMVGRLNARIDEQGWGLWAVEAPGAAPFIGFVGLNQVPFEAHFTPAVEVGWRLARQFWGFGYATEAASAALDFAFEQLKCEQVVSFTASTNLRSMKVMQRLGMTSDPAEDFDHPNVASTQLARHVLYRISEVDWRARRHHDHKRQRSERA